MGLFEFFKNKNNKKDDNEFDNELENLEDLMYEAPEQKNSKSKRTRRSMNKFDSEEEAKLEAQLNQHIADNQLKEQYEKALKERESKKIERINLSRYSKADIQKYMSSQCDLLNETSKYVNQVKEEYSTVTSYFSDIQLIETAPDNIRKNIKALAEIISGLTVDRRIFHSTEPRISNSVYFRMERIEPEMPGALVQLQNHESYFQTVKKDLKILEGERLSLRYDARDLVKKQKYIKKISMLLIIGLLIIFGLFIASSLIIEDQTNTLFLIVIGVSALFAVGLFALLKTTEREVVVTEIKLNKVTNLLNKIKIKYINSANTLDYECAKYGVKNSFQLSKEYEAYLEIKKEKEKISKLTDKLNDAELNLELVLKKLQLYDPHIWLAQVKALIDEKEMLEVKRDLTRRRDKLRLQIEYNMNRIEEVKMDIKQVTRSNPEYTDEVLRIIENYEAKN